MYTKKGKKTKIYRKTSMETLTMSVLYAIIIIRFVRFERHVCIL